MKTEEKVKARIEGYKRDPEYQAERLSILITAEIVRLMESEGVSRSELASRMGVSKALISRLLGGTANMTLRTLVTIAVALESEISFKLRDWKDSVSVRGAGAATANVAPLDRGWRVTAPRAMQIADKPVKANVRSRKSPATKRSR